MLRCGSCNAAVIRSSCFQSWKHYFPRFSSSSSSGGKHHLSPVPTPLNSPSRPKRRHRRQSSNARKMSPPRPRPNAVAQPPSSPADLFERISTIVGSGGREPAPPALPASGGGDVEVAGEDDGMCGQDARRNAPENFLEMPGSIREEQEAKLVCNGDGAFNRAEDVSPAVQKITEIVRAANHGTTSMEERLESSGVVFTPDVVEMVLKRCFKAGHSALRFFHWARRQPGYSHPTATYNAALYIAGEAREFDLVEKLLEWMGEDSCPTDVKTWTILICHYGKAKQIGKALWAFEQMKRRGFEPDKMAYEAIIRASCEGGKTEIAMEFYKEMVGEDMGVGYNLYQALMNCLAVSGDVMTLRSVGEHMMKVASESAVYFCMLKSLCISERIEEAMELVDEIKKKNLTLDPGCAEILVKGLSKAGRASEALKIVEDAKKNHFSGNKVYGHVIGGYLRLGNVQKALELLQNLKELGSLPMVSTYTEIIQHLFRSGEYQKACELYDEMLEDGIEPDVVAITAMVAGHVRSGHILEAWNVFEDMKKKGMYPTWKCYSVFIKELCRLSKPEEAFKLLIEMAHFNLNPKDDIVNLVISLLRRKGELEKVRRVEQISRFFNVQILDSVQVNLSFVEEEPKILDCSVDVRRQSNQRPKGFSDGDLREVCKILSSSQNWVAMTEDLKKSAIHFTPEFVEEILRSCQRYGRPVLQFFSWIGKVAGYARTTEAYNMAIKISGSGKDFAYMRHLYQEMKRRGCLVTADTWTIMIAQYGRAGLTEMALKKFKDMKDDGFLPNGNTYKFLISFLCGKKGRKLPEAITAFQEMLRAGYMPDKELAESYLSCLCESGKIHEARKCLETLRKNGLTAQTGYSLLTKSLCRAGLLEEAVMLVNELSHLGCEIDQYIYGSLVHGLLRGGRQEEAFCKIEEMKKSGIQPTVAIYTSLIVQFFKERHIAKALEMFKKMREDGFEPTVVTYSALIRGYVSAGMISDAWDIYYRMATKGPLPDFHTYSMFITCLCRVGRSEEGLQLLHEMLGRGIFPSTINFRTVSYGLNREGKQDLAHTVLQAKWRLSRERKFLA
ncbi:hypothetical protein Taro_037503 [Colocasia esculenta]|uniref:Pentatricopeptide repeat-containing protein n=1 Tax=Colocasia esculenta TaxID=4460 RepID=A0A843WBA9_COLES|nr:hypothetical protein [Colocasia esculenta]